MFNRKLTRVNATIVMITGFVMLLLGIYFVVTEYMAATVNWYYWFGLIVLASLFIISGIRQLKKFPEN